MLDAQGRHRRIVESVSQVILQQVHSCTERRVSFCFVDAVRIGIVSHELRRHPEALKDVDHSYAFAQLGALLVLVLVDLQDHHVRPTVEHKVRTVVEALAALDTTIATVVLDVVRVQPLLYSVLFRQSRLVEFVGIAVLAFVVLVEDHRQPARHAASFHVVEVVGLFVLLATDRYTHSVDRRLFADRTFAFGIDDHPRLDVLLATGFRLTGETEAA